MTRDQMIWVLRLARAETDRISRGVLCGNRGDAGESCRVFDETGADLGDLVQSVSNLLVDLLEPRPTGPLPVVLCFERVVDPHDNELPP